MWLSHDYSKTINFFTPAHCSINVSLWTGACSSPFDDNFRISLTVLRLATVLLLLLCDQARPWFRFYTWTSSVAELALCLVALTWATLVTSVLWRVLVSRSVYLTFDLVHKYPREGSKILAFLLATERNQLWSVYFDPLLLEAWSVFFRNAFCENFSTFFF